MFSDNKKNRKTTENTSAQNIISKGSKIIGDFESEGDFRIDGVIEGNIKTKGKVVIGETGTIVGALQGADAYIEGIFSGSLKLSNTLTLKSSARVDGEIEIGKLSVEPGADFNVSCIMKSGANELLKKSGPKKTKKNS
ncbi:MAG: polymer-forming cytoskeletal protein [Aestuariibaculum sp.]